MNPEMPARLLAGNDRPPYAWDASIEACQALPYVRVLIIDDFKPWSELAVTILREWGNIDVVGVASTPRDGIRSAVDLRPDVVLLDIYLPGMSGFEAAQVLQLLVPESRIIFVSDHHSIEVARAAVAAGVRGYVAKSDALRELAPAVAAVAAGKMYMSRELAAYPLPADLKSDDEDDER